MVIGVSFVLLVSLILSAVLALLTTDKFPPCHLIVMIRIYLRLLTGGSLAPEGHRPVVQVVPQLEVWDLAVLFGAVRLASDCSWEPVRLWTLRRRFMPATAC